MTLTIASLLKRLMVWLSHSMDAKTNRLCPFLASPLPKCYCLRAESIWAVRVVEFCAGRFELCEYYRMHCSEKEKSDDELKE